MFQGASISKLMLIEQDKARYIKMKLTEECVFSSGWLAGFKAQHAEVTKWTYWQKLSYQRAAEEYTNIFARKVQEDDLTTDQIYNTKWNKLTAALFA